MQKSKFYALGGGLDLVSPKITMKPGRLLTGINYSAVKAGYRRDQGYERFDGQPKPSEATYWVLSFDQGQTEIEAAQTITGATSGATAIALYDATVTDGAWAGSDAVGSVVLVELSGTFEDDENLEVSAATVAVANGTALIRAASDDESDLTYRIASIERRRALISAVPGSGAIRGLGMLGSDVYAIRDNAGGTAGVMHKATSSGWVAQDLGLEIAFSAGGFKELAFTSGGTYTIAVSDEIEGETGGATATVQQVILESGSWAGGDAAGRLVLTGQTGNFEAETIKVGANTNVATIAEDSATVSIDEGDTITGETSGATADVTRVLVTSGSFAEENAAGYLYLTDQTGTFQSEAIKTGDQTGLATIGGDSAALSLPAGGRYEIISHNFYGASNLRRMYGANGVGRGFEWDGSVFVPLRTGLSDALDKPQHISVHNNHLFLSFAGGSVQHSATGDPVGWTVITGAGEIGIGEDVTGFMSLLGILVIVAKNKVCVLYGDDAENWNLKTISDDSGGLEWTAQNMGVAPIFLDDGGIRTLQATDAFGDFRMGTLSEAIDPLFEKFRKAGALPIGSIRLRGKDQYRLFYDNAESIELYLGDRGAEYTVHRYDHAVRCSVVGEDSFGNEIAFFGADNGFVYQFDAGTNFDGEEIEAFFRLAHNHLGSPYIEKRFHAVELEVDASPSNTIGIVADFGYSDPDRPEVVGQEFIVRGGGGYWNDALWNDFYWSAPSSGTAFAHIDGKGPNMSLVVSNIATYEEPFTVTGMTVFYSDRRAKR